MRFAAFWGLQAKRTCFWFKKMQLSIYQSQSIPTSNEQMMETKLWLLQVNNFCIKKRLKNGWNIAFMWLQHDRKPVGLYENTSWFLCHSDLMIHFFIQTSCFFFVEKSSRRISSAVGAHWNPCIFMSFHSISSYLCRCFKAILLVRFLTLIIWTQW